MTSNQTARKRELAAQLDAGERLESVWVMARAAIEALNSMGESSAEQILHALCRELEIGQGSVALLDRKTLRIAAAYGHSDIEVGHAIEKEGSIAWAVVNRGQEMHLSGVFDSRRTNYQTYRHSLVVPIRGEGAVLGTININRRDVGFGPREMWLALAAGEIMARVIDVEKSLAEERHPLLSGLRLTLDCLSHEDRQMACETSQAAAQFARSIDEPWLILGLELGAKYSELARILLPDSTIELTPREQLVVPAMSAELVRGLGGDRQLCELLRDSAERFDGAGPLGKSGDEISVEAQLMALARMVASRGSIDLAQRVRDAYEELPGAFSPQLIDRILEGLKQD